MRIRYLFFVFLFYNSCTKREPFLVNGKKFIIKGVNYNPVSKCHDHLHPNFFRLLDHHSSSDIKNLKDLGINTLRIYTTRSLYENNAVNLSKGKIRKYENFPVRILDNLHKHGIKVIISVGLWLYDDFVNVVKTYRDHPAVLFYMLGNEFVENSFYSRENDIPLIPYRKFTTMELVKLAKEKIKIIKKMTNKPVAASYGKFIDVETSLLYLTGDKDGNNESLDDADIISYQIYNQKQFDIIFKKHHQFTSTPFFISEYGVDAYDMKTNRINEQEQAHYNYNLSKKILENSHKNNGLGAIVFSYQDEWWKNPNGNNCEQETSGFEFDYNYPDKFLNEEYWGLIDINRKKRKAYYSMKKVFSEF